MKLNFAPSTKFLWGIPDENIINRSPDRAQAFKYSTYAMSVEISLETAVKKGMLSESAITLIPSPSKLEIFSPEFFIKSLAKCETVILLAPFPTRYIVCLC